MAAKIVLEATVTAPPWPTLGATPSEKRRLRTLWATLAARGIPQEAVVEALRGAYWAARRSLATGVEARHRKALQRRLDRLALVEEAITALLDLEEPVSADLAGQLYVTRAQLRREAREAQRVEVAPRGRPRGWHVEAEGRLMALGLRRAEARVLLARVERLVRAHPVGLLEIPPLKVAFRQSEPVRTAILQRLPFPAQK